eukprot:scaffold182128_cov30-Attheya_sp.AAC.1
MSSSTSTNVCRRQAYFLDYGFTYRRLTSLVDAKNDLGIAEPVLMTDSNNPMFTDFLKVATEIVKTTSVPFKLFHFDKIRSSQFAKSILGNTFFEA